jgi:hypothetical protein
MARTVLQIYDEMIAEKQTMANLSALHPSIDSSQNLLTDLTSASNVAAWRLLLFVVAFGIWTVEKLFDSHVEWINNRANEIVSGTLPWYVRETLKFQYGDSLIWDDDRYKYAVIDPTNQIVKLATANESGGVITLKTAKLDGSGQPEQLSSGELSALEEFWSKWKFGGARIQVVSRPADLLKVYFKVYYDPLVLTSTGELISTPGVFPVEAAIKEYIKSLPFDGVYSTTALTDRIQNAQGVVNPVHLNSEKKFGAGAYSPLIDYYQANAGYLKIDPAFPLSLTITYVPEP